MMINFKLLKLMFHKLELAEHQLKTEEDIKDFPDERAIKYHRGDINLMIDKVGCIEEIIRAYLKVEE